MSLTAVCTLFEGNYHYGIATLINSLAANNYVGCVYIGYRGELPTWVSTDGTEDPNFPGVSSVMVLKAGLRLVFLRVDSSIHFTNYKPSFALNLLNTLVAEIDGLFYFDPDIVVKANWQFFEHWISCGVPIVHEVVQQSLPDSHPIRQHWRNAIAKAGLTVKRTMNAYCNAGFFGIRQQDVQFLKNWIQILIVAEQHYQMNTGALQQSGLNRTYPFFSSDQDAMNAALMTLDCPVSEVGPDGMDFIPGGWIMSHATGSPKPWSKGFIRSALKGVPPSMADKQYWNYVAGPIPVFNSASIRRNTAAIKIASFIGRWNRRF